MSKTEYWLPKREVTIRSRKLDRLLMDPSGYEITPWSNMELLNFEQFMEDLENSNLPLLEWTERLESYIEKKLVKPHIDPVPMKLASIDILYLFVKIYELSKGPKIELVYTCPKCGVKTPHFFDITNEDNFTTKPYTPKADPDNMLKVSSDMIVKFKAINFYKNSSDKYKYLLSYISSVVIGGNVVKLDSVSSKSFDEFVEWFKNSTTIDEFEKVVNYITEMLPSIEFKIQFECSNKDCGYREPQPTQFPNLPDFSLRLLRVEE